MRRTTIYAIAAGAAVSCFALVAPPACGGDANLGAGALPAADDEAPPLVAPQPASDFSPADGDAPPEFVWSSDVAIAPPPPPYLAHGPSAHLAPPSATATAIPYRRRHGPALRAWRDWEPSPWSDGCDDARGNPSKRASKTT